MWLYSLFYEMLKKKTKKKTKRKKKLKCLLEENVFFPNFTEIVKPELDTDDVTALIVGEIPPEALPHLEGKLIMVSVSKKATHDQYTALSCMRVGR